MTAAPPRLLFVSPLDGSWGGSEWLWAETALRLARAGRTVGFATAWSKPHPLLQELRAAGAREFAPNLPRRWWERLRDRRDFLRRTVAAFAPDLTLLSLPRQHEGLEWHGPLREAGRRYAIVNHLVVDYLYLGENEGEQLAAFYQEAQAAWFVSHRSWRALEAQLGIALPSAGVVWNPYRVPRDAPFRWPDGPLRLAMPSRLDPDQKGHDLVFEVLAEPRWRERPVQVRLYGGGSALRRLRRLRDQRGLQAVRFEGFVEDMAGLWADNHVVLMPSRQEGMPIAMIEGMLMGRPVVATAVGGMSELVTEGETGFIAPAPEAGLVGAALERMWERRPELAEMGARAQAQARARVPADPVADFAAGLEALL